MAELVDAQLEALAGQPVEVRVLSAAPCRKVGTVFSDLFGPGPHLSPPDPHLTPTWQTGEGPPAGVLSAVGHISASLARANLLRGVRVGVGDYDEGRSVGDM